MLYVNVYDYADNKYPFQIFIGGRGTGKTYSALSYNLRNNKGHFLFMRRTNAELEICMDNSTDEGANPFKVINRDMGTNVGMKYIVKDKLAGIYDRAEAEDGTISHIGAPIGYAAALSTLSGIRGMDFSDITDWVYDEFIPENHVRKMKAECDALLNAYESICRNRELDGKPPVRLWLLANSNNIYNEICVGLGIVADIEKMINRGQHDKYYPERGLAVHLLEASEEFVEKKKDTALYRLTKGTLFYDMSLENKFAYNDFSLIAYRKLTGYSPICSVDDAFIYQKKGSREIYVSYAPSKCSHYNSKLKQDVISFKQRFGFKLEGRYVESNIIFESYALKQQILDLIL